MTTERSVPYEELDILGEMWHGIFDSDGIRGDRTGTAYDLTIVGPDTVRIAATPRGHCYQGVMHQLLDGTTDFVLAAPTTDTTYLIALAVDFTDPDAPGQIRIVSGQEGLLSAPTKLITLYRIRRQPSVQLSMSAVTSHRYWSGDTLRADSVLHLPDSPVGSIARTPGGAWVRKVTSTGVQWVPDLLVDSAPLGLTASWEPYPDLTPDITVGPDRLVTIQGLLRVRAGATATVSGARLAVAGLPTADVAPPRQKYFQATSIYGPIEVLVSTAGLVTLRRSPASQSGATTTFTAGQWVSLDGISWRAKPATV